MLSQLGGIAGQTSIRTRYGTVVWWRSVVATKRDPVRQHLIERTRLCLVEQRTIHLLPRHVLLHGLQRLLLHFRAHVDLQTNHGSTLFAVTSFISEHRYIVFRAVVLNTEVRGRLREFGEGLAIKLTNV